MHIQAHRAGRVHRRSWPPTPASAARRAALVDDSKAELSRADIVELLDEARKAEVDARPALYVDLLDPPSKALNHLHVDICAFKQYVAPSRYRCGSVRRRPGAVIMTLSWPPPGADLSTQRSPRQRAGRARQGLSLEEGVVETEAALSQRLDRLARLRSRSRPSRYAYRWCCGCRRLQDLYTTRDAA